MIVYDKTKLHNLFIKEQVGKVLSRNILSPSEASAIVQAHPVGLYSPGWIARFGLFIATSFGLSSAMGMYMMIFMSSEVESNKLIGLLIFIFGAAAWYCGEIFIKKNAHFRSGVDDALLYGTVGAIMGGLVQMLNASETIFFLMAACIGMLAVLRYNDRIMVLMSLVGIGGFVFKFSFFLGGWAKALLPIELFLVYSALFFGIRQSRKKTYDIYEASKQMSEVVSLILMYVAVNYYVVREASVELMDLSLKAGQDIPLGWLFWMLTGIMPLACFYFGVRKNNIMLLRVAALFTAATICTIRYYYHVLPVEVAMLLGGIILIAIGWWLLVYLKEGKGGFVSHKTTPEDEAMKQLESLVIAESFHAAPQSQTADRFGGGSFGGGGATGDY